MAIVPLGCCCTFLRLYAWQGTMDAIFGKGGDIFSSHNGLLVSLEFENAPSIVGKWPLCQTLEKTAGPG